MIDDELEEDLKQTKLEFTKDIKTLRLYCIIECVMLIFSIYLTYRMAITRSIPMISLYIIISLIHTHVLNGCMITIKSTKNMIKLINDKLQVIDKTK